MKGIATEITGVLSIFSKEVKHKKNLKSSC